MSGPSKESLLHLYVDFMKNKLVPELQELKSKYDQWWTFKSNSTLKTYLEEQRYIFPKYFSPDDLLNAVSDVFSNMTVAGNSDIIELDGDLQLVFDSWIIYRPNLMQEHLMPHVIEAPVEISHQLTNEHIMKNLAIESSYDILYKDPSSVFWFNPIVDFLINNTTGNTYSWQEIVNLFTDFCTNNKKFFTRHSDYIISVNEGTPLTKMFYFKYFHITQIEQILTKITRFLGRRNGIFDACAYLKYNFVFNDINTNEKYTNLFTFIDDIINNNNVYLPFTGFSIYI
jgi:hypothetical protein